jgi:hypothetical protein
MGSQGGAGTGKTTALQCSDKQPKVKDMKSEDSHLQLAPRINSQRAALRLKPYKDFICRREERHDDRRRQIQLSGRVHPGKN